jgi:hypothetical protein
VFVGARSEGKDKTPTRCGIGHRTAQSARSGVESELVLAAAPTLVLEKLVKIHRYDKAKKVGSFAAAAA